MKTVKIALVSLMTLVTVFSNAATEKADTTNVDVKQEIVEGLNIPETIKQDLQATESVVIRFHFNENNELVVDNVLHCNKELVSYITEQLNGKVVNRGLLKKNKVYRLGLSLQLV